ncbi:hypothetical protein AUC60_11900 [Pseudomonas caspiana]|uniref:Uncharacterized protein n=1 Tax=Pseudomonas caspiana TaxID=1451454 RepID=A0A1Y3P1T1_9PSED|nr:hypothetical protein AUC60_11900 [Pseudomonas caspiana]
MFASRLTRCGRKTVSPTRWLLQITQIQSTQSQDQPLKPNAKTRPLSIGTAADNLLLCAQGGASHFEAIALQVVTQPSFHRQIEFIVEPQRVKETDANSLTTLQSLRRVGTQDFETQLGELAVPASLRALISIASSYVEKHCFFPRSEKYIVALLKKRGCLRDEAAGTSGLIIEGPHLPDYFTSAGLFDKSVLTP